MSELDRFRRIWQEWATDRDAALRGARGQLALVARADVFAPDTTVPVVPGTWSLREGLRGLELNAGAEDGIRIDGELVTDRASLHWLAADGPTTAVLPEGSECVVSSRDGAAFTLEVWDPRSARIERFERINRYVYDPSWIVPAQIKEPPEGRTIRQRHSRSEGESEVPVAAEVVLTIDDRYYLLQATLVGDELVMRFSDDTSGQDTPRDGRVITLKLSGEEGAAIGGVALIDLNRAELPTCSLNPVWDSPVAPEDNYLPIELTAGEKRVVMATTRDAERDFSAENQAMVKTTPHHGLD